MQALDHEAYLALREGAQVLEADGFGDKVLLLRNGNFLKLFRRKRLVSSAAIYPYAQRFADNIAALQQRGIACPEVMQVYRITSIQRDAVLYIPLPGITLRQALTDPGIAIGGMAAQLTSFIAHLHQSGVYFRSLHLGNILLLEDQQLGLIDVADMKCHTRPLSTWKRKRNLQHLLRYPKDRQLLEQRLGLHELKPLYR